MMHSLREYLIRVRTLDADDTLGTAAEAVRNSRVGAVPVMEQGRPVGLISASVLGRFLAGRSSLPAASLRVADLVPENLIAIPEALTPVEALLFLQANRMERAPVVDPYGRYVGMVSAADLACVACGRERPSLIGGMATPFGVYLTGGGVRAGVGDFALLATGALMSVLLLVAYGLADWVIGARWWGEALPLAADWIQQPAVADLFSMVVFGMLFRWTWVTGYHAAEHQVVHAMEAGDELEQGSVSRQPRVHPRCGTNLMAAVLIMSLFWRHRFLDPGQPVIAMLVTLIFWRRVGSWIQQHVTTRPATPAQIHSGISAAQELLFRYQSGPRVTPSRFARIWNMGILQVMTGATAVVLVLALLQFFLPLPDFLRVY